MSDKMTQEQLVNFIASINEAKMNSLWQLEDNEVFVKSGAKLVAEGLDVDKHRWYEISTSVYNVGGMYVGFCGLSDTFGEETDPSDCCVETMAFEMKEVASVKYVAA